MCPNEAFVLLTLLHLIKNANLVCRKGRLLEMQEPAMHRQ